MQSHFTTSGTLLVLAMFTSSALAQPGQEIEPLPTDPNALVALMAGADLPKSSMKRVVSETRASRSGQALMIMKDEALPALTKGLDSEDYSIRLNVVHVLNMIDTPATLPLRLKAASDVHPQVREQALVQLPAYTSEEAHRTLLAALKDPHPEVRIAAIGAFWPRDEQRPGNVTRYKTASAIIPLLNDPPTQRAAADALGRLEASIAVQPLLTLIQAEDRLLRIVVIDALGKLKAKHAAMELAAALSDKDPGVRRCAATALGQVCDLRTTPALVESLNVATVTHQ